jgi:hypothetical protein
MYEPIWYGKKTLATIAEAIGTASAFSGFALRVWAHRRGTGTRLRGQPATATPSESAATNFGPPFS